MDTLFERNLKFSEIMLFGGVLLTFVLSQSLFSLAGDVKIAQGAVTQPVLDANRIKEKLLTEFSPAVRAQQFEDNVKKKYPKAIIYDVDKGVKHIKLTKYYNGQPVRINVVEADLKLAKGLKLTPALSSENSLHSRRTISTIANNNNAIVALNGTFFKPQTGVPLGTLMINQKMYTGPIYDRVAMGIFEKGSNKFDMARVALNASIKFGKNNIKVDNINQPRMLSTYVLAYTSDWGKLAPPSPKYGIQIAIENDVVIQKSVSQLSIPENGYVIVGPQNILDAIDVGVKLEVNITTIPEWKNVEHIISGGPHLVKENEVFVDMTAQKLGSIGGRNPRSAIGYTAEDVLVMVTVDGREGSSVGMTLIELANFMKSAGCVNAMNLDGGGSTVMYVDGKIVNNPQQKGGIPVSNAIILSKDFN